MRGSTRIAVVLAIAVPVALLTFGVRAAQAQLVSSVEAKCASSLGKSSGKLAKTYLKSVAKCRDADIAGKTIGACPDSKGLSKIGKAAAKLTSSADKSCQSTCSVSGIACVADALCPPLPALGSGEKCTAGAANQPFDFHELGFPGAFCEAVIGGQIDSTGDIAACVDTKTQDASAALVDLVYGSIDNASGISGDAAKCLAKISTAAQKLSGTIQKGIVKCRGSILSGKVTGNPATCTTDDEKLATKIAKAEDKLTAAISACTDSQIAELDLCLQGPGGVLNTGDAIDCLIPAVSQVTDSALNPADRVYAPSTLIEAAYPPTPACGDGVVNQIPDKFLLLGEECDLGDDSACPGDCLPPGDVYECTCGGDTVKRMRFQANGFTADLDNGWTGTSHQSGVTDKAGWIMEISGCDCDSMSGMTCVGSSGDPICDLNGNQKPTCSWDPFGPLNCEAAGIDADSIDDDDDCWICDQFAANAGSACVDESDCTGQCYPLAGGPPTGPCPNGQGDCAPGSEICRGQCDRTQTCIFIPNGAPLPISSGGTAVCVVNILRFDMTGTLNIETGEHAVTLQQYSKVHLGVSNTVPCPTCGGFCDGGSFLDGDVCEGTCSVTDTVQCRFNDDCPSGETCTTDSPQCPGGFCNLSLVCNGGPEDALPCRISAETDKFGTTSSDCPPNPPQNISGNGLEINFLPQTSETVSLPPVMPCTAPGYENFDCPCPDGGSPGRKTQPNLCGYACNAGAEFGVGCGSGGGAIFGSPTVCENGSEPGVACDEDADCGGGGTCTGNPSHCLGGDNSQDRLPCSTNADCAASGGTCEDACPLGRCVPLCVAADDAIFPPGFGGEAADDPEEGLCAAGPPTYHCSGATDDFRICDKEKAEATCDADCSISGNPCSPLSPCPEGEGVCEGPCELAQVCEAGVDGILGNADDFPGAGICVADARNCFVQPILAEGGDTLNGNGDPTNVRNVAAYCIGKTSNNAINSTAGLGGPGRLRQDGVNVTNGFTSLP